MSTRHQLCYTLFYALPPSLAKCTAWASPLNLEHGACEEERSGACFYGGFTPSFPASNWIFLQHALRLTYIHPSHTHTHPPPHHIHNHMQMLMHRTITISLDIKPRGCVKSIYPDDYVLLLVVHPTIEPFTTRNSVPSVERCGVCKLPRLVPGLLSPSTSSMHNMMRLLPVLLLSGLAITC